MADYVDQDGNPIPESELHKYQVAEDAERPKAMPADRPAPARSGARRGVVMVAAIAVLAGGGYVALDRGWLPAPAATPAAAPSASAAPATATTSAAPSTSSTSSSSPSSTAPSAAAEPVQVSNERYVDAKWGTPPVRRPGARLRITDGVALPASVRNILDVPAAKAFDSFKPYTRIAMSAPDVLTVQTVARAGAGVRKPWSDVTVSIAGGKPVVKGEKSGDDSADSADLVDTDGAPEADTDGGVFQVEGDGIPESAKGKRSGTVTVSTIKRDANANSGIVWIMVGDKLFRAVVEDMSGGSAGQDEEGK